MTSTPGTGPLTFPRRCLRDLVGLGRLMEGHCHHLLLLLDYYSSAFPHHARFAPVHLFFVAMQCAEFGLPHHRIAVGDLKLVLFFRSFSNNFFLFYLGLRVCCCHSNWCSCLYFVQFSYFWASEPWPRCRTSVRMPTLKASFGPFCPKVMRASTPSAAKTVCTNFVGGATSITPHATGGASGFPRITSRAP